ncbi:cyclopropane-fatty-acyl-phospholipid synthase family protein [Aquisalimonas sp. 2447]|uniref:SAM-dependent methyltransferase n=1 Tax=Aquisalimonas sp. 2447 TaxID=2740807 RepID=UPI0020C533B2|nr:cyclopropane-fatty-acyl-phospholipid synthase family protein [Aquisalimonas sp. 2447]
MTWEKSMAQSGSGLSGFTGRYFARVLGRLQHGTLDVEFPDGGQQRFCGDDSAHADLRVQRPWRLLWRLLSQGHLGMAEGYLAGDWDTGDLSALLQLMFMNEAALARASRPSTITTTLGRLRHRLRSNTPRGSRRNIAAHYDLGNAFYSQWLDPSMTYSSALFGEAETPETDRWPLEKAQEQKYRRMLSLLEARPGDHILEIGCGWGGFGREAAAQGHRVTGLTLSREQLQWAREAAGNTGLDGSVDYVFRDYRNETQQYDHVASIEMFEAVGEQYWPAYFRQLAHCLKPGGRAALQVITIDEAAFATYRRNPDFIQLYIFPGGMLPTTRHLTELANDAGLTLRHMDAFGLHYAETLRLWHERFLACWSGIKALGYDDHFMRMWRYYLSYCEVGFRMGRINLMQLALERPEAPA